LWSVFSSLRYAEEPSIIDMLGSLLLVERKPQPTCHLMVTVPVCGWRAPQNRQLVLHKKWRPWRETLTVPPLRFGRLSGYLVSRASLRYIPIGGLPTLRFY
jgi:hypothetical protein